MVMSPRVKASADADGRMTASGHFRSTETTPSVRFPPRLCENGESAMIPGAYALGAEMKRFVEGEDRKQGVLLPEYLDDYDAANNPVRMIDVFVGELDLSSLGFAGIVPEATCRPVYLP